MILALDLSSSVGFTFGAPGCRIAGGCKKLPPMIEPGRTFNAYGDWLCDVLSGDEKEVSRGHAVSLVVMEAPMDLQAMARCHTRSIDCYQQMGLAAVTDFLCDRFEIPCRQVPVLQARREVLGRSTGWDKKNGEIVRHLHSMGFDDIANHDEGDSLVVWLYACKHWREKAAA